MNLSGSSGASLCHCEEFDDVAILAKMERTSSASARAVFADSLCLPNLGIDCHVVELLAMTIIPLVHARGHNLS